MKVDKYLLETMNKRNIINIIRTCGPINKAEISKLTDLSIPTVMKICDSLIEKKIIKITGKRQSNGGKRPEMLMLAHENFHIIGVDIGRTTIKVIVIDMCGKIINRVMEETGDDTTPSKIIKRIIILIKSILNSKCVNKNKIIGIGIGMPGLLDTTKGIVLFSPDFGWENVNLIKNIKSSFNMPIYFENSNRTQAMGEKLFGAALDANYFISVNLGYGIGSAIIENGELYVGSSSTSGEFGHITLEKDGDLCSCGNRGCLEVLASGNAIAKLAKKKIKQGEKSIITKMISGNIHEIDAKVIYDAAKKGDELAKSIVSKSIEYIGIGIANYINMLDPELIILAGGITNAGDILLDEITKIINSRKMKFAGRDVKIKISALGADGTAIGAASLILKAFIECGGEIPGQI